MAIEGPSGPVKTYPRSGLGGNPLSGEMQLDTAVAVPGRSCAQLGCH